MPSNTELTNNTLYTAGEAYIQTTANKWLTCRKHLNNIIVKINKAINRGEFEVNVEPGYCTADDIEFLQKHGYKFIPKKDNGTYYDIINWDIKDGNNENTNC